MGGPQVTRVAFGMLSALVAIIAQSSDGATRFEVASIKLAPPLDDSTGLMSIGCNPSGGRIDCQANLKTLIGVAFSVTADRIFGPGWLTSQAPLDPDRYAVSATFVAGTPPERLLLMLQNLLIDRFKLVAHREKKDLPAYVLTVDSKGSKLKPAGPGNITGARVGRTSFSVPNMSMEDLVMRLIHQVRLDRPVIDQTHLDGRFDITLEWSADDTSPTSDRPGLFAALREQLGLRLAPQNAPVDVIVVDHAEKTPTAN